MALFDLPDISNTTGILEYTKWFFRGLIFLGGAEGKQPREASVRRP